MFKSNKTISFLWFFIKKYKFKILLSPILMICADNIDFFGRQHILKNLIDKCTLGQILPIMILFNIILYTFCISIYHLVSFVRKLIGFKFEDIRNNLFQKLIKQTNTFF